MSLPQWCLQCKCFFCHWLIGTNFNKAKINCTIKYTLSSYWSELHLDVILHTNMAGIYFVFTKLVYKNKTSKESIIKYIYILQKWSFSLHWFLFSNPIALNKLQIWSISRMSSNVQQFFMQLMRLLASLMSEK
jgi:hypothetical protein